MLASNGLKSGQHRSEIMRNVVAIIGSAGKISEDLRLQVEELAKRLSNSGFDLVTGGMDGVMRAVARGHSKSHSSSKLVHVEPGWGDPWHLNPFEAGILKTELGSMRNHLVIRSSDIVMAISGGSGTLSEIAIAWQEGKPIATLATSGGWSETLAGQSLDHRRNDSIAACDSVNALVNWANEQCPEGVFPGRINRGFYPFEVPSLHRIHEGEPTESHVVNYQYGMSIELGQLVSRLEDLNAKVETWNPNSVALVTFDDGWADVLLLEETFDKLKNLKPVLFIPESQFSSEIQPLPMQRLYQHIADKGVDWGDLRAELKTMSERDAHLQLDERGVDKMLDPDWLLKSRDIERLSAKGWVIASHGHKHEDLRTTINLHDSLLEVADAIETRVHIPWLAWPEGRWSQETFQIATKGGFTRQFGLFDEPHEEPPKGMVMRKIWRD